MPYLKWEPLSGPHGFNTSKGKVMLMEATSCQSQSTSTSSWNIVIPQIAKSIQKIFFRRIFPEQNSCQSFLLTMLIRRRLCRKIKMKKERENSFIFRVNLQSNNISEDARENSQTINFISHLSEHKHIFVRRDIALTVAHMNCKISERERERG